ncbi:MAG: hypothetical protein Q9190_005812 [Brigantiaea leucoxantha]
MALALANAAPLRPDIKLAQALKEYEAALSDDLRKEFKDVVAPDSTAVIALTSDLDRRSAGHRTRRYGARLTTFLNSVKGFASIGDLVIMSSGNPIAAAVWGAVKGASQVDSYFQSLSALLMSVGLNSPRITKYRNLYPSSTSLQKAIDDYFSVVVQLCTSIILFLQKPAVSKVASAFYKPFADVFGTFQKDLIEKGEEVKQEITLASQQLQHSESIAASDERRANSLFRATSAAHRKTIAMELAQARKRREETSKADFLNACSTYDYEVSLNQARKKGASSWIFNKDEYQEWKASDRSSTLLCCGIVGAGKTVLSASVIENLILTKSCESSLSYFFCRSDDFLTLRAREILGCLAFQLFKDLPSEVFVDLHKKRTFGVDELLSFINTLPQSRILLLLSMASMNANYIGIALHEAIENERLILHDPNIVLTIQDALERGAHDMFLWVAFQIESLCAENTDHDILSSLEHLPKGLPATFRRIIQRLNKSVLAKPDLAKTIFEIIAAARRPLTLNELGSAISVTPGDTRWDDSNTVNDVPKCLQCCGTLIVIDEEFSTVHFAHSSVKQYITSEPSDLDISDYHTTQIEADLNLNMRIITYLNFDALGTQLAKYRNAQPQEYSADIPSHVVKSSLPTNETIRKLAALTLLRNRKTPSKAAHSALKTSVLQVKRSQDTDLRRENLKDTFYFLSYYQDNWLCHSQDFYDPINRDFGGSKTKIRRLWKDLVDGKVQTVTLPWTLETKAEKLPPYTNWAINNNHVALSFQVLNRLVNLQTRGELNKELYMAFLSRLVKIVPSQIIHTEILRYVTDESPILLMKAVGLGHKNIVQACIETMDTKTLKFLLVRALIKAQQSNQTETFEILVKSATLIWCNNEAEEDTFCKAIEILRISPIMRGFPDPNLKVDSTSEFFGWVLIIACFEWRSETVIALLNAGAEPDSCSLSPLHLTPLTAAVVNDDPEMVIILLEARASIDFYDKSFKISPKDRRDSFVSRVENVFSVDPRGKPPLTIAVARRCRPVITTLLQHGASLRLAMGLAEIDPFPPSKKFIKARFDTTEEIAELIFDFYIFKQDDRRIAVSVPHYIKN